MVGGKAFATYTNAKRIVKLVTDVGAVVNNDPDVNKYLKVSIFPACYPIHNLFGN
jgi:starch phosphorylase